MYNQAKWVLQYYYNLEHSGVNIYNCFLFDERNDFNVGKILLSYDEEGFVDSPEVGVIDSMLSFDWFLDLVVVLAAERDGWMVAVGSDIVCSVLRKKRKYEW